MNAPEPDGAAGTSSVGIIYRCCILGRLEAPPSHAHLTRDVSGRWWVAVECPCGEAHQTELTHCRHLVIALRAAGVRTHLEPKPADASAELADPARRSTARPFGWRDLLSFVSRLNSTQCIGRLEEAERTDPGASR